MKTLRLHVFGILATLLVLVGLCSGASTSAEMQQAVAATTNYQWGASRQPLFALEDLVRQTTDSGSRQVLEREMARALESGASVEARQFLCRQLWTLGTAVSVPAVAALLADPATAEAAAAALAWNPSPEADAALRAALPKAEGPPRLAIINALGQRRSTAAVRELSTLAMSEGAVAEAALIALGRIAAPEALETLARVRDTRSGALQRLALDASLRCAESLADLNRKDAAVAVYQELLRSPHPPAHRRAALRGLVVAQGANAVPALVAALQEGDPLLRRAAIGCIGLLGSDAAIEKLAAQLPQLKSDEAQALLIGALADQGFLAARPAIVARLDAPGSETRLAAIHALGTVGNADSVPLLVARMARAVPDEAAAAQSSLLRLRGDGINAALVRSLDDAPPRLLPDLIQIVAERDATLALPWLMKKAVSPEAALRRPAAKAIGRLARAQDLPGVVALLVQQTDSRIQEDLEQACIQVARGLPDESARADALLAALPKADAVSARLSLLRVLSGIANRPALGALIAATEDRDADVRDLAIRALADWPDAAALEPLGNLYRATPDATLRVLALRGYLRLLALPSARPAAHTTQLYHDALARIRTTGEKKLVLAGLGHVPDLGALRLAEPFLDEGDVQAEAALATVQVARQISGSHRAEATAALKRVLATTQNSALREQAQAALNKIEALGSYLTAWEVAGPYTQDGKDYAALFEVPFPPEQAEAKGVAWRTLPVSTDAERPWLLDLLKFLGGDQRVAYLRTRIHSDREQPARLEFGSDDGVKIWLNGKQVSALNVARPLTPGSDKVDLTLQPGANTLLVKITQNNQGWEFCARLVKPDGSRLDARTTAALSTDR